MKLGVRAALAATLLTFAGTQSGCYMFQKSDSYYGLKTEGQKVIFVLDVSGSMEGKNEGTLEAQVTGAAARAGGSALAGAIGGPLGGLVGRQASSEATKLGGAKRELIPAVQGLPESAWFSIITFGNSVEPWQPGLVQATAGNRNIGVALINQMEATGGTPARQGLERAFGYADADVFFFVSDGRPTDASATEILKTVRELNGRRARKVSIYAIGLGDDQDESFMRALASENGGKYVRK